MSPLPCQILPLCLICEEISAHISPDLGSILPAVSDLTGLAASLKAHPVRIVLVGPGFPADEHEKAAELVSLHAAEWVDLSAPPSASLDALINAALARRESRICALFLQQLADILPDPVFFKDIQGRFLFANPAIAQHFGAADARLLIGRTDFDFFGREHASNARADELEIMRTATAIEAKLECENYDESRPPTWCLSWKAPLRDEHGRVIGIHGFSRDVTSQRRTEATLATERHLIDALLTGLPDAIFVKDRESRFLLANPVMARWMGTDPAGLRGKTDADFCRPELAAQYRADEETVMSSGLPLINREEKVVAVDGREMWFLTSKLPYHSPEGEVIGLIGISRNISIRKSFDQELRQAKEEIVALRAEITRLGGTPPA